MCLRWRGEGFPAHAQPAILRIWQEAHWYITHSSTRIIHTSPIHRHVSFMHQYVPFKHHLFIIHSPQHSLKHFRHLSGFIIPHTVRKVYLIHLTEYCLSPFSAEGFQHYCNTKDGHTTRPAPATNTNHKYRLLSHATETLRSRSWTLCRPKEMTPGRISSGWPMTNAVCHPDGLWCCPMSSGWDNKFEPQVIRIT